MRLHGALGDDELSRTAINGLNREGVNTDYLVFHSETRPIHSTIIIGQMNHTRNIFFQIPEIRGTHPELPKASLIRQTRVLLIEDFSVETTICVTRIAAEANIPIVADFELGDSPQFPELLAVVDHLVLSHDFASKFTGETEPAVLAEQMWTTRRKVVVISHGAEGARYITSPQEDSIRHQPASVVEIVDTTGCGDVFHGGYAAGLVYGMTTAERIRFASAAAALKATKPGGQAGISTLVVVKAFLKDRTS